MANISDNIAAWSATAASNQPDSSDANTIVADFQALQAGIRKHGFTRDTIASGTTVDLSTVGGPFVSVTHAAGTTSISSLGTLSAGMWKVVTFAISGGTLSLTYHATQLILPGAANITLSTGESMLAESLGSGNWKVHVFQRVHPLLTTLTNSLTGDVAMNNISNYFTGPTVAQGTTGTWFASGTVTVIDGNGAASYDAKLWDGTTVIASARITSAGASFRETISLSGYLASPAGNIRISVKDISSTGGTILFNESGNSKDSTLSVIRVA